MIPYQQGYFDPNMLIINEMLQLKMQIQQYLHYIFAEINKIARNNLVKPNIVIGDLDKVIEANKKEETAREKLKKYTKPCKFMNQCEYVSKNTCWFLHEQTNSSYKSSDNDHKRIEKESNYENELSEED